ncbi:hypothetical protein EPN52_03585 [bacterium]|nr:MAG: hypothetical protein EPN52_03585 [bacterium]
MHRTEALPPPIDPAWQAWVTECCDPYAWRKLHAAVAGMAATPPTLADVLSWQDSGIVPPADQAWALGEVLFDAGIACASGLAALWFAGRLPAIVCIMASRGGRWPQILHALALATAPRAVVDSQPGGLALVPSPYREIVTLTGTERATLRELWRTWGGRPRLPAPTSGYYRGLHEIVADVDAPPAERRRLLDAMLCADLPSGWPHAGHGESEPANLRAASG